MSANLVDRYIVQESLVVEMDSCLSISITPESDLEYYIGPNQDWVTPTVMTKKEKSYRVEIKTMSQDVARKCVERSGKSIRFRMDNIIWTFIDIQIETINNYYQYSYAYNFSPTSAMEYHIDLRCREAIAKLLEGK